MVFVKKGLQYSRKEVLLKMGTITLYFIQSIPESSAFFKETRVEGPTAPGFPARLDVLADTAFVFLWGGSIPSLQTFRRDGSPVLSGWCLDEVLSSPVLTAGPGHSNHENEELTADAVAGPAALWLLLGTWTHCQLKEEEKNVIEKDQDSMTSSKPWVQF